MVTKTISVPRGEVALVCYPKDPKKPFGIWTWHEDDKGSLTVWMSRAKFTDVIETGRALLRGEND